MRSPCGCAGLVAAPRDDRPGRPSDSRRGRFPKGPSVTIRHSRALAVAAVAGLFALCAPASAAAATPTTTTSPAPAAAGWLAQQFAGAAGKATPAGDHFNFPGTTFYWSGLTASAVFALAASKSGGDKVAAAISFMQQNVAADANLGQGAHPGPFDGSVATAALAAIVAGADPTNFGGANLLATLKSDECSAVSAPVGPTDTTPTCPAVGAGNNVFSSVSESLILLAEARAGGTFAPSTAAVDYFLTLQCSDGGFTVQTNTTGCASDVDATAYAIAALVALGSQPAVLSGAAAWLLGQRQAAGYWIAQGGANVDSTGLAASALDATGADTSTSRTWLASQQVTTGPTTGTGASRGALKFQGAFDATSSIKATADGLLGLVPGVSLATLTAEGATSGTALLALDSPKLASASVMQGSKQTVTGTGFGAGEKVSAVLHSAPIALSTVSANTSGTAVVTFTVPATLAVGPHSVVLTGATSGLTSTASFTVTAAPVAPVTTTTPTIPVPAGSAAQGLANSGLDAQQALIEALVGLGCIVAGAGALYLGRRRRA